MSHYFETPATLGPTRQITATIWGHDHVFTTAPGVFSGSKLDLGTFVLLREVRPDSSADRVLDLGCGYGPIAIALATELPTAKVDAVDVNELALELTRMNATTAEVADRIETFTPEQADSFASYDEIWSNPPIRIGKEALHELLLTWLPRLRLDGCAYLVVGKNLGADSLQRWLEGQGWAAERLASAKGFRVLKVFRH